MITAEEWAGDFGDEYTARNLNNEGRGEFWNALVDKYEISNVLEVGCGIGANLRDLDVEAVGVDVNESARDLARADGIATLPAEATDLPFATNAFDLVFTYGVLIHIPPEDLECAMREIVRCSRRYVFAGEYFAAEEEEVPYRGGVLWRRDYGGLYEEIGLNIVENGFLEGGPWGKGPVRWWLCRH